LKKIKFVFAVVKSWLMVINGFLVRAEILQNAKLKFVVLRYFLLHKKSQIYSKMAKNLRKYHKNLINCSKKAHLLLE